jgi:hypothetical protein
MTVAYIMSCILPDDVLFRPKHVAFERVRSCGWTHYVRLSWLFSKANIHTYTCVFEEYSCSKILQQKCCLRFSFSPHVPHCAIVPRIHSRHVVAVLPLMKSTPLSLDKHPPSPTPHPPFHRYEIFFTTLVFLNIVRWANSKN